MKLKNKIKPDNEKKKPLKYLIKYININRKIFY